MLNPDLSQLDENVGAEVIRAELGFGEAEPFLRYALVVVSDVILRDVAQRDLSVFFEQQLDPAANAMAAFTAEDPADREAFTAHWTELLGNDAIVKKTILFDGHVAGNVVSFERFGQREVGYWLAKRYWSKGIATAALAEFLGHVKTRPLYARAAKDNLASIRVLQKCGFAICGEDAGFSNARGEDVEEFILRLEA